MLNTLYISKSVLLTTLLIIISSIAAGLIAGNQVFGIGLDFPVYTDLFNELRDTGFGYVITSRYEVGFGLTSLLLISIFCSSNVVYGILSAVSFTLKIFAIRIIGTGFWFGILYYVFRFFPLHEMTQLRVAIGSGLAMLSIVLEDRGYHIYSTLMICLAITFHWSFIIILPFIFIKSNSRTPIFILILAIAIFVLFKLFHNLIFSLATQLFQTVAFYESIFYGSNDVKINYFPLAILLDSAIVFISLFFWKSISPIMRKILIAQIFSTAIFYAFIDFPVIAWRFHDLFSVLMVIFVSAAFRCCLALRSFVLIYVVLSSAIYIYIAFVKNPLFSLA